MAQRPQNRNYNGFPPHLPFSNPNQHFPNSQRQPHYPYNNSQFAETLEKPTTYRRFNGLAHDTIIKPLECISHTFCIPCLRAIVRDCLQFPSIPGLSNIIKAINVLTALVSSIEWSDLYYVIGMGEENSDEFQNENENENENKKNQFFQNGVIEFYKKKKNCDIFLNFYNFLITSLFKLAPIYHQEIQKSLYLTPLFYENRDVRNGQQFMNNNQGNLNNFENNNQNNVQHSNLHHRNPIHMSTPHHISQSTPQKSTNNTYDTRVEPNKGSFFCHG